MLWLAIGVGANVQYNTEAVFHRQSGNNLLLVGQRDEAVLAIFSLALISLAAQHPAGQRRSVLAELIVIQRHPQDAEVVGQHRQ